MKKIIFKSVIILIFISLGLVTYLSFIGIKTSKLNDQISNQIKNIDKNLSIELKDIFLILDPLKFKINAKTVGANLIYENKLIQLENIQTSVSLKSLINNKFSIKELNISTKSLEIKNFISFFRKIQNDPRIYLAERFVKKGYVILDLDLRFDEKGGIDDNYEVKGFLKDGRLKVLKKYDLDKIDLNFNIKKDYLKFNEIDLSINDKEILIPEIILKKENEKFFVSGKIKNKSIILKNNDIKKFFNTKTQNLDILKAEFSSTNNFEFLIDEKYKLKNFKVNSLIDLNELIFKNDLNLKEIFPKINDDIFLKNHKINFTLNDKDFSLKGSGDIILQKFKDKIDYTLIKKPKNLKFNTKISIIDNLIKLDILNYQKLEKSNLNIQIQGNKIFKKNIIFEKISLNENKNNISINNLILNDKNKIEKFQSMNFNYVDKHNIQNEINIKRKNKDYFLKGKVMNLDSLIENFLNSKEKKKRKFLNGNFNFNIDIKRIYLDKNNELQNLKGNLNIKNNDIFDANLESKFSKNKKISFSIKTKNNEKITTLFSDNAEPLVSRYKFIKGFNEGKLDFYSTKKNDISNSTLKIYNFKLKELPVLTKLLTLASLQGIADILSGEGIRFNDFEMNFTNKTELMTIDEIYAIGPAISILMSGYIEKDRLISLRGTLVPATTINKTIGSIPFLGDILVGKKVGEGVFGVSFKIKGPENDLQTTVNPIKTLTPRFITRTLEKIKKN